jgi:hypothetical protein
MAGNRFLTLLSNMFTNLNLTDMEMGYKAFKASVIKSIQIEEDRFGFEPEITAKLARMGCRVYEVGHFLQGSDLCRRQKDQLERRRESNLCHSKILSQTASGLSHQGGVRWRAAVPNSAGARITCGAFRRRRDLNSWAIVLSHCQYYHRVS